MNKQIKGGTPGRLKRFLCELTDVSALSITEDGKRISLFSLSVPTFLQYVFFFLIGTVNTFMLSGKAEDAVGAQSSASQVITVVITLLSMIDIGSSVMSSIALGKGNRERAARITGTASIISITLSLIGSAMLFFLAEPLMTMMNLDGTALEHGVNYMKIRGGFLFIKCTVSFLSAMLICNGNAVHTMITGVIGNTTNVIFGYLFLYTDILSSIPASSAVAYAGVLSSVFELLYCIPVFIISRCPYKFCFDMSSIRALFSTGVPGGMSMLSYVLAQTVTTGFMGAIGATALNAKSYVSSIVNYTYTVSLSIGTGTKILMGRFGGKGDVASMKKLCNKSLMIALSANLIFSLAVLAAHKPLLSIFTSDQEIFAIASVIFIADVFLETARAANHVLESALNACLDVKVTFAASVISCWLGSVLLSYVFGIALNMGLLGCWIAFAIDECVKASVFFIRWKRGKWVGKMLS